MYLFLRKYTSLTSRDGEEEATGVEGVVKVRVEGVSKVRGNGCRIDFAKSNKCCTFVPAKSEKEVWVSG